MILSSGPWIAERTHKSKKNKEKQKTNRTMNGSLIVKPNSSCDEDANSNKWLHAENVTH